MDLNPVVCLSRSHADLSPIKRCVLCNCWPDFHRHHSALLVLLAVQGNWGVTLLTYGQHKQSYLAMLQETGGASPSPRQDTAHAQSVMAREAAAIEASKARLRQESQHALVRAGQMFREVVKVGLSLSMR